MRFLLTNDDGISAPGLKALEDALAALGERVVVAPAGPLSGCGHRVTTHAPLAVERHGENRHAVHGTPADCTRLGLKVLAEADWVIAGINDGGNLGWDIYPSGTVAAVREAAFLGKPAIAISHYKKSQQEIDWRQATEWAERVVGSLLGEPLEPGAFWNVNFPHLAETSPQPEIVRAALDHSPLSFDFEASEDRFHYRGSYHHRAAHPESDVSVCFSGHIAVTKLSVRLPSD